MRKQHPELDIRFVFSNPRGKLSSTSKTTYVAWCDQYGFKWCGINDVETLKAWAAEEGKG